MFSASHDEILYPSAELLIALFPQKIKLRNSVELKVTVSALLTEFSSPCAD